MDIHSYIDVIAFQFQLKHIPYNHEIETVSKVFKTGWLAPGEWNKKFESASKIPSKQLKDIEKKFSNNSMQKIIKDGYELVKSLQIKGVTNISVPLFDYTGSAIGALTIPFMDRIISTGEPKLEEVKNLLKNSGKRISSDMGFKK